MTSLKTLLFGTTLAAGAAFFMGTTAHADEAYTVQSGDTLSTISQKYVGEVYLLLVSLAAIASYKSKHQAIYATCYADNSHYLTCGSA